MNRGALAGQPTRLGDVLRIKHGFAFKGEFFSDEPGKVILTPGNFNEAGGLKFRAEKDRSYTGAYPSEFELKAGNLLVVMTDLTQEARILGAPAFVPPDVKCLHNQRLGKIVDLDTERLDRRFLYHMMNGADYRRALKASATGSTVRHTSPGRIYDFQVCLPEISEQRRIASILSAYDDLIEVNRRRVAILEDMARRLFEEWFVHLRFPGHQAVPFHDAPDGPVPEGWRNVAISSAYNGLYDGPHATPPAAEEGPIFLGINNVTASGRLDLNSVRHISEEDFGKWTRRVVPQEGDIVFTYEATLNRYALIPPGFRGCLGRRLALIRANSPVGVNRYLYLYFFTAAWRKVVARNTLSGATVDRIPLTRFPSFPIMLPPNDILSCFDDVIRPIFGQLHALEQVNYRLAAARDLLLPRLLSGQLPVTRDQAPMLLGAE